MKNPSLQSTRPVISNVEISCTKTRHLVFSIIRNIMELQKNRNKHNYNHLKMRPWPIQERAYKPASKRVANYNIHFCVLSKFMSRTFVPEIPIFALKNFEIKTALTSQL